MLDSVTLDPGILLDASPVVERVRISALATHDIEAVAPAWQRLSLNVESPGQTLGFTRLWVETLGVPVADRVFVVGEVDGVPVALLPLVRRRRFGVLHVIRWIPGAHVGCNAPVVDKERLLAMSPEDRRALWATMLSAIDGGDIVYLGHVPEMQEFSELGTSIPADLLYRAEFSSWDEANTTQRSKSRRKHDRQQGERLEALGQVSFAELGNGDDLAPVIEVMFRQRAARFVAMGVKDPFASPEVRRFYIRAAAPDSPVAVRLHVLRLDGEIVAVRYNVVEGTRMFCLISSMSEEPRIQGGSPGKQCLLRVMQTVFDAGISSFDMGAGYTDEKRHWCNVQVPVRLHYLPQTFAGRVAAFGHWSWHNARRRIKHDPRLLSLAKKVRAVFNRGTSAAPRDVPEQS